jgi:hypothetical protein
LDEVVSADLGSIVAHPAETLLTWLAATVAFILFGLVVGLYAHTQRLINIGRIGRACVDECLPTQPYVGLPVALSQAIRGIDGVPGVHNSLCARGRAMALVVQLAAFLPLSTERVTRWSVALASQVPPRSTESLAARTRSFARRRVACGIAGLTEPRPVLRDREFSRMRDQRTSVPKSTRRSA